MKSSFRNPLIALIAFAVLVTACVPEGTEPPTTPGGPHPAGWPGAAPVENLAFHYMPVPTDAGENPSFWGEADIVVTSAGAEVNPDEDDDIRETNAVDQIHATGAKAYRYVNFYWYPKGKEYQDLDIGDHPEWQFCRTGNTPTLGRVLDGFEWYFIDLNERAARNATTAYLRRVHEDWGYDGIFIDRGGAALSGGTDAAEEPVWFVTSTCTEDPVIANRRLADAFVGMVNQAKGVGLDTMLNYGRSPFHRSAPLRPDPANSACQGGWPWDSCPTLNDAWASIDFVLDENPSQALDRVGGSWLKEWSESWRGENDPTHSGKIIGLVKAKDPAGTAAPEGGSATFKKNVYYQWASAKLANQPLAINTGDDFCDDSGAEGCWRHGTRKELTALRLGKPQGKTSWRVNCASGSSVDCIHIRRYSKGIVMVNASNQTRSSGPVSLNIATCRELYDLYSERYVANGGCYTSINRAIPAHSGRVYRYET